MVKINRSTSSNHKRWSRTLVAVIATTLPSSSKPFSLGTHARGPLHILSSSSTLLTSSTPSHSRLLAVVAPETFEESLISALSYYEEVNSIRKTEVPMVTKKFKSRPIRASEARSSSDQISYPIERSQPSRERNSPSITPNINTLEEEISGVKISSSIYVNSAVSKSKVKSFSSGGRSSTMPGFMNRNNSGRHEAFRDGLNNVRNANTKVKADKIKKSLTSKKAVAGRKKANSAAMYASSSSVPDSMIAFTNEIHQVSRITPLEEKELGTQTQESIRMQNIFDDLEKDLNREPTDDEWCAAAGKINMDALRRVIDEGNLAKNRLVTSNLRMVQGVVNLYIRNGLGSEFNAGDLMQEGTMALIRAAEKFEPQRGFRFSTYAMYWIRSSVKRSQVLQSRIVKVPQRIHETHKKILKFQLLLEDELGRPPTSQELAEVVGISKQQLERCFEAIAQKCFSLDADIENTQKPGGDDSRHKDSRYDIIDGKYGDADYEVESEILKGDLVDTLRTYLSPENADLLLMRYGLLEDDMHERKFTGPLTIAQLSQIVGLKPDKVRRTINKSLLELRHLISHEWSDYERDLMMSQRL